jgi:inosine/xanthosine triphosphatase
MQELRFSQLIPTRVSMPTSPRGVAIVLLRVGTLPFVAIPLAKYWATLSTELEKHITVLDLAIICYAGIILAFIGGLQQAAAISTPSLAMAPLVSLCAIVTALVACGSIVVAALLPDLRSQVEVFLLAAYVLQMLFEALLIPDPTKHAMLHGERRPPMVVAAASLLLSISATPLPYFAPFAFCVLLFSTVTVAHVTAVLAAKPAPAFDVVAVGTKNACKVAAVRRALASYPEVAGARHILRPCSVPSRVPEQPMSMEVTTQGAKNRAMAAYQREHQALVGLSQPGGRLLGLGIESGLFELDGRHYDVCVVSAYDGATHHLGLSCAFEIPNPILRHVTEHGKDLSQACLSSGITRDTRLGEHGGLIGLLSSNRLTREDYTVQALETALFFALEASSGKSGQPKWFDGGSPRPSKASRRGRSPARR